MKNITLTTLLLFITITAFSQSTTTYFSPLPSPQASVSQNVGMTKISISYSSPGVKERKIFGELVPYDQIWRAGANSPTIIKFSTSVKIGDKTLRAGEYSIAITPRSEGEWTVDFNSAGKCGFYFLCTGKIETKARLKKKMSKEWFHDPNRDLICSLNMNDKRKLNLALCYFKC